MARLRSQTLALDPELLRELRRLASRIPDDADERDPALLAFARFCSTDQAYDLRQAGLHLSLYVGKDSTKVTLGAPASVQRDRALAWLEAQRG